MRIGLIIALSLTSFLLGATCVPLVDNTVRTPLQGDELVIEILDPTAAKSVKQGAEVTFFWTAANLTGETATVSLSAESRSDLTRTTLVSDLKVDSTGGSGEYLWNTAGYAGPYSLIAHIETASLSNDKTSAGLITVLAPPTLEFTAPTTDASFTPGQTPVTPITISWTGAGTSASAYVGLDPDTNHGKVPASTDTGRNEIFLDKASLPAITGTGTFSFSGKDASSAAVAAGTYYLFAILSDGVNDDVTVNAAARITVTADNSTTNPALAVKTPASDTQFLTTDNPLSIQLQINQTSDVLVDIKIDTDDSHSNGNEITILSQRLIATGTTSSTFDWDGTNSSGNQVPDGIYRIFAVSSTGTGTPTTAQASGLVFRRSDANQSLVALLQPSSDQTVTAGSFVSVQWRDNVANPSGGTLETGAAKIRLTIDDDATPDQNEPGSSSDMAELEILADRDAVADGVQDTFSWQVPSSLGPGTYYVFAYIDHDDSSPADNASVAAGRIIIKSPTQ